MTYQLTVVYGVPEDSSAFDSHYESTHAPLAQKLPGLQSYTSHKVDAGPGGRQEVYLVAVLTFADQQAFGAAMSSEEGKATAGDVPTFASGGAQMLAGEVTTYA